MNHRNFVPRKIGIYDYFGYRSLVARRQIITFCAVRTSLLSVTYGTEVNGIISENPSLSKFKLEVMTDDNNYFIHVSKIKIVYQTFRNSSS